MFYRQTRLGKNGKPFLIVKFRTMISGADQLGPLTTEVNDRRLTRVGRYLRSCHLDESPQVLNVLKGEMSLVGPRPLVAGEYQCEDWGILRGQPATCGAPGRYGSRTSPGGLVGDAEE